MRKLNLSMAALVLASLSMSMQVAAHENHNLSRLDQARKQTVKSYLGALQSRSVSTMSKIFTSDGTVISTSVGRSPAVEFFNNFLPKVQSASVSIGSIYKSVSSKDQYGASFSLHYVMKDGSKGGGSYADEFFFAKNSQLLKQVIMYENLHI